MQSKTEEVKRKDYLKYLTNYLGNIEETEDKIICYIDKKKLLEYNDKEDNGKYVIRCSRPNYNEEYKDYKLNKSVCFILNDLVFSKKVEIYGENEIIINNCYFGHSLNIKLNGKCFLSGNTIAGYDYNNHPKELLITAKELVLNNNRIILSDVLPHIDLRANNSLTIINNDIAGNNVSLNASNVNIINSKIIYKDINYIPESLTMDDSSFLYELIDKEIIHREIIHSRIKKQ